MPTHSFLQQLTILYTLVLLLVAIGAPFESCAPQNSALFCATAARATQGDGGTDTKASSTRPADVGQQLLRATSDRGHRRVAATHLAVLYHRARALAQGARRFLRRHRREQLEIVEGISGFRRLLHLQQIVRPHHTPVLAHRAL